MRQRILQILLEKKNSHLCQNIIVTRYYVLMTKLNTCIYKHLKCTLYDTFMEHLINPVLLELLFCVSPF